jgi:hypothetical protein
LQRLQPALGHVAFFLVAVILAGPAYSDDGLRPDSGKKIKVFLFAGQSNMEGRADGTKLTEAEQARLRATQNQIAFAFNGQPVGPLDVYAPSEELQEIYQRKRMFGPEIFFGMALAEAWPEEKFLFIKWAEGATSLHGRWNPNWSEEKAALMGESDAPPLYETLSNYTEKMLAPYSPDEFEIVATLWAQGESDGKVPEAAAAYGATLGALIERTRTDTGLNELPFLFFQVGSNKVVKGMKETAAALPHVTMIPQSQEPDSPDFYKKMRNGHYNYAGMKKLGNRFAEVYLETYATTK